MRGEVIETRTNFNKFDSTLEKLGFAHTERITQIQAKPTLDHVKEIMRKNFTNNPLELASRRFVKCSNKLKPKEELAKLPYKIPVALKEIPAGPIYQEAFRKQIRNFLDLKLIKPAEGSPRSFPAFMVNNHNEQKRENPRMVINYIKLNEVTVSDNYRLPNKDELASKLEGCNYFSKLDCKSGFYQVQIEEDSIQYTSFNCCEGTFVWLVMPMGYKNAPAIFQRMMDGIL